MVIAILPILQQEIPKCPFPLIYIMDQYMNDDAKGYIKASFLFLRIKTK